MKNGFIYASFIVFTIILHLANINGGYFSDDFTIFFPKGEINIFSLFFSANPYEPSVYRPLAGIYNGVVQYFFGTNAFLIHLMNLLLHGVISCVIYKGMIRLNMNKQSAIIASVLFIVAQSTVTATLRNCTMTQQLSCLFNLLFIYVLVFQEKPKIKQYLILCGLYVLGLLSKEASLAILPTAIVLIFIMSYYRENSLINGIKNAVFQIMPYIILTGAYFILRLLIGLPFSDGGRAKFSLDLYVVKNLMMLLFSNTNHFSSTDVFYALVSRNYTVLLIVVFVNMAIAAFVFWGVFKKKQVKLALVLILLMIISFFPTVLMPHVSELYGYNAMPFICIIYAIGFSYWLSQSKNKKNICIAILSVIILLNVVSLQRKALLLNNNANMAQNLITQLQVILEGHPSGTQVFLINTDEEGLRYSYGNFHMTAAETLQYAEGLSFLYFLGRDDISFFYREKSDMASIPSGENIMLLTVVEGNLVPYIH